MKKTYKIRLATTAATVSLVLVITACGSSSSSSSSGNFSAPPAQPAAALPAPGVPVPASAANSFSDFITYLMSLTIGDETSEPSPIADSFATPDDQTNDPAILS